MLPRSVIRMLPDDNDRDAKRDGYACLNERATQVIVALGIDNNNIGVANVLFVLKPKLPRELSAVWCPKGVMFQPSSMGLNFWRFSAQSAPLRGVFQF